MIGATVAEALGMARSIVPAFLRSTCTVERRGAGGWAVVASNAPCVAVPRSATNAADADDAGPADVHVAAVLFAHALDVRAGDRLTVTTDGVTRELFAGDDDRERTTATRRAVLATDQEAAIEPTWLVLRRKIGGVWTALDPQPVQVAWDNVQPTTSAGGGATTSRRSGTLIGGEDFDVAQGDTFVLPGGESGWVTRERPAEAGQREAEFTAVSQ